MIKKIKIIEKLISFSYYPRFLIHLIWICEYFFNHNYYNKYEKIFTKYLYTRKYTWILYV